MQIIHGYGWEVLLIPALAVIISQLIKVILHSKGRIAWEEMNRYGGMPSSHTALFVSLSLITGLVMGFTSPLFFITGFISATFIRDAVGIRWALGFHGKMINKLVRDLSAEERAEFPLKPLDERLGHTPLEAIVGGSIGAVLTLVLHYVILAV